MNDDVRSYIYNTIIIFLIGVMAWVGFLYLNACGFSLTCHSGDLPVYRTPVPTLIPAAMPVATMSAEEITTQELCQVVAVDLVEAWVASATSENEAFQFVDANGVNCETKFVDAKSLFDDTKDLAEQTIFIGKPAN